ncbi:hypothetical protein, partial [Frankia sp. AvcI1]
MRTISFAVREGDVT